MNTIVSLEEPKVKSNIKWLIAKKGMKQYEIAEMLEVSPQQFNLWATGRKFPRIDKAQQLANILECKLDDLYEE